MALTITNRASLWNTTAGNKAPTAFVPTLNWLLVVVAGSTASGSPSPPTNVTDNNPDGNGTYTKIVEATGGGTNGAVQIWVRNALIGNTGSTTVTATISGDTGGGCTVFSVAGGNKAGTNAVIQSKAENTQTESPPSFSFTSACGTGNGGILAILGEDNPPTLTAPTNWPESIDTGYATPTTGIWIGSRNSTAGDQTLNWTGGALTDHCDVGIELNADLATVITAPLATATADAVVPVLQVTLVSPLVTATADGIVPTLVTGGGGITVIAPLATATADGSVPVPGIVLPPPLATAAAAGLVPILRATVLPATATATADAPAPVLLIGIFILPPIATATASGLVPTPIIGPITILAPTAMATAQGIVAVMLIGGLGAEPVRDPQATLTGVRGRARLVGAEANAVLGDV